MTPAARLSAAIEIMADIEARKRPANDVLKDWGLSHRFAGSGDRAAIAVLVYDTLRRRASAAHITGSTKPRALVLGALRLREGMDVDQIAALCTGERFAPEPLTDKERATLDQPSLKGVPEPVMGDYPAWLDSAFSEAFGEGRVEELAASARNVGYPVIGLVSELSRAAGDAGGWTHWGATTQDIMDTATVLQVRDGLDLIDTELRAIATALAGQAEKYRDTVMAGRTHLQQALPTTFGLKCAIWGHPFLDHRASR